MWLKRERMICDYQSTCKHMLRHQSCALMLLSSLSKPLVQKTRSARPSIACSRAVCMGSHKRKISCVKAATTQQAVHVQLQGLRHRRIQA